MSGIETSPMLAQLRNLQSQVHQVNPGPKAVAGLSEQMGLQGLTGQAPAIQKADFSQLFSRAINNVNDIQKHSNMTATRYEQGDPSIDIGRVMLESQKSSLAFETTLQVRNRLVSAYQDIMNMPV
ncbi:flagellar hook-basal body complex protein FliE [Pelagibaculum spongiae]|nr:flagellar hook-basal body complex protein FliE [Pelagibaculum spongiae]